MNTPQHVPGPYTLGDESDACYEVELGDSNTCASICRFDRHTNKAAFTREEMIATGHLFIAAPDLLEALQELANLGSLELPNRRDAALTKARAAIAKATRSTN